jgi:hypothetical protein
MSQANEQSTQFSDYPVNLFEESRDHANQWDVRVLSPDPKPQRRKPKEPRPTTHRPQRSRDHANLWDVSALSPEPKPRARGTK